MISYCFYMDRLKYTYMEEMLEEVARARQIFERWMQWEPEEEAWMAYVKFEKRYKELERARVVYERFVHIHPEPKNWIKWAEFEEREGKTEKAREIFTRAIEVMGEELMEQRLFISFAKFETRLKEVHHLLPHVTFWQLHFIFWIMIIFNNTCLFIW